MANKLTQSVRAGAYRWVMWQAVVTILMAIAMWGIGGNIMAYSALLGGGICVIANAYFATRLFVYVGAGTIQRLVKALYRAEFGKFAITACLFFIIIKFIPIAVLPFFATYIVTQMVLWFALLRASFR